MKVLSRAAIALAAVLSSSVALADGRVWAVPMDVGGGYVESPVAKNYQNVGYQWPHSEIPTWARAEVQCTPNQTVNVYVNVSGTVIPLYGGAMRMRLESVPTTKVYTGAHDYMNEHFFFFNRSGAHEAFSFVDWQRTTCPDAGVITYYLLWTADQATNKFRLDYNDQISMTAMVATN